jgi:hypothetical protein
MKPGTSERGRPVGTQSCAVLVKPLTTWHFCEDLPHTCIASAGLFIYSDALREHPCKSLTNLIDTPAVHRSIRNGRRYDLLAILQENDLRTLGRGLTIHVGFCETWTAPNFPICISLGVSNAVSQPRTTTILHGKRCVFVQPMARQSPMYPRLLQHGRQDCGPLALSSAPL